MMAAPSDAYTEAAIEGKLAKLHGCPPGSQDGTMFIVAVGLAGMVKGWGLNEDDIRERFFDACASLASEHGSPRGPWTKRHFEQKWQNAMRDAEPRAP
jgi:hypothetical protein